MSRPHYLDFELVFRADFEGFIAQVLKAPGGESSIKFTLPFSEDEAQHFFDLIPSAEDIPDIESKLIEDAAKSFGGRLFDAVFGGDLLGCYRTSFERAKNEKAGLRLRLRLSETPQLASLPWEYLYQKKLDQFLVLSSETPVIRHIDLPLSIDPLEVEPPFRVLVMISSPSDRDQLDVNLEIENLKRAIAPLRQRIILDEFEKATLPVLHGKLREKEYHIFHFIGHAEFDPNSKEGELVLEDEHGLSSPTTGQKVGTILRGHPSMRLAVINACEGAHTFAGNPFSGVAQSLVQQGIPAVVAMQFKITDDAAIIFAESFYQAIADFWPVDGALAEARRAIFARRKGVEWGTPVLFMRAPDGYIFSQKPVVTTPPQPPLGPTTRQRLLGLPLKIVVCRARPIDADVLLQARKWWDKKQDPLCEFVVGNIVPEATLQSAFQEVKKQLATSVLLVAGFSTSDLVNMLKNEDVRQFEIISVSADGDRIPSASLLKDGAIISCNNPVSGLRKAMLRRVAKRFCSIRLLHTHEDFRRYFDLRYQVWKELDYIPPWMDSEKTQLELDFSDRLAMPIGAFTKEGQIIGCARLVRGLGEEVPQNSIIIKGLIDQLNDPILLANYQYPKRITHPYDLLQSFPAFADYYQTLVKSGKSKAEVSRIIVSRRHRTVGLGEVLVDSLISLAIKEKIDVLFLACKAEHQKFYERSGFQVIKGLECKHFAGVNVPAIAMELRLEE